MTWLVAPGLFVEPAVGLRLGGNTPDVTFSLNLPYTFGQPAQRGLSNIENGGFLQIGMRTIPTDSVGRAIVDS